MTLLEVMVAIGILLVMSAVVFESLQNSITFSTLLSDRDETTRTARAALSKIKRDLQLAYLTPNITIPDRYQTVFVGFDDEPDRVFFASLNHQRKYLNSRECSQTEITIWAENAPKDKGSGYVLYHREAPRIDQFPDEQGPVYPLAYNVRSFRLRYLDQQTGEWRDEWDSRGADTPYRLPRAVEIALVLIAPDPNDRESTVDVPFLSRVMLEYAPRMPNSTSPLLAGGAAAGGTAAIGGTLPSAGGLGGGGFGGLSGGGTIGGPLGTLPGAQPPPSRGNGRGGSSATRPRGAPAAGGGR